MKNFCSINYAICNNNYHNYRWNQQWLQKQSLMETPTPDTSWRHWNKTVLYKLFFLLVCVKYVTTLLLYVFRPWIIVTKFTWNNFIPPSLKQSNQASSNHQMALQIMGNSMMLLLNITHNITYRASHRNNKFDGQLVVRFFLKISAIH